MVQLWLYTLGSVVAVSLVALIGLFALSREEEELERITPYLVSLAVGALLGGAVLHLVPRAVREHGTGLAVWLYLLAGFVGSFVLEKFLKAHHGHHALLEGGEGSEEDSGGPGSETDAPGREHARPLSGMVLFGDGVHNLLDGVVIAASYAVDPWVGLVTTLAVFLHEIPQELGDFGALLRGGLSPGRALLWNFLSALTALAGAVATLWIGTEMESVKRVILPLAAGNFLYIAASDLVPELHRERGGWMALWQIAIILAGIGLMLGVRLLRQALA